MDLKLFNSFFHRQKPVLFSIAIITPAGFAFKYYNGPVNWWFNDYGAGVLYEVFWVLVVFLFFQKTNPVKIAAGVFLITCVLEILQLWHPPVLQTIRRTFLGGVILGSTFVWWDFPHYALGSALGWLWLRLLQKNPFVMGDGGFEPTTR